MLTCEFQSAPTSVPAVALHEELAYHHVYRLNANHHICAYIIYSLAEVLGILDEGES